VKVKLMANVLGANDEYAAKNREVFERAGIVAINVMGSPGSGKTTILENTIRRLGDDLRLGVIEGDLFTTRDAERIEEAGAGVFQINTGGSCHLNAVMVHEVLREFPIDNFDLLFIENVGNLVCPASFDLGESHRVTVFSVTEGADKASKYPKMFRRSQAILVNKLDLLDHTNVDMDELNRDLAQVSPNAAVFYMSATTDQGMANWLDWVRAQLMG